MNRAARRASGQPRTLAPAQLDRLRSELEALTIGAGTPQRRVWLSPPVPDGTEVVAVRREQPKACR